MKLHEVTEDQSSIARFMTQLGLSHRQWDLNAAGLIDTRVGVSIPSRMTIEYPFGIVSGYFDASRCVNITDLTNFPNHIETTLLIHNSGIRTLKGIGRRRGHLYVGHTVVLDDEITNILGLVLLRTIQTVEVTPRGQGITSPKLISFDVSHGDIHQFQEELIDAGLDDMARL